MLRLQVKDLSSLDEETKLLVLDASLSQNHLQHYLSKSWLATLFIAVGATVATLLWMNFKELPAEGFFLGVLGSASCLISGFWQFLRLVNLQKWHKYVFVELEKKGLDVSLLSHTDISEHIYVPMMKATILEKMPDAEIQAEATGKITVTFPNRK